MSNLIFSSDWHLGHKNIGKFRRIPQEFLDIAKGDAVLANYLWLNEWMLGNVRKRDIIISGGDSAFTEEGIDNIAEWPGTKHLYGGNHDDLPVESFMRAFDKVRGCKKMKGIGWISHFPLHPDELRGHFSIHGHVHYQSIDDWRYVNICCDNLQEQIGQPFIDLKSLRKTLEHRRKTKTIEIIL